MKTQHLKPGEALRRLEAQGDSRFIELFKHGDLSVELYAPRGTDPQQPHARDEVYFVACGAGLFWDGEKSQPFGPGDFLFVAAGQPHRFEEFSDDLAVWVLFFGRDGGE